MTVKRFSLFAMGFILTAGAGLALALLAVYHHPPAVKGLLEGALSARLGAAVTIDVLDYRLAPMQVDAANISIRKAASGDDLDMTVSRLTGAFRLEGPFGRRTLVIDRVAATGVSVRAGGRLNWRDLVPDTGPPSALGRLVDSAVSALLFSEVRIGDVALSGGEAVLNAQGLTVALHGLRAGTTAGGIRVDGDARILWPATGAGIEAPAFGAVFNLAFSGDRDVFKATLLVPEVRYAGPPGTVTASGVAARVALSRDPEAIRIEEGRVHCQTLTIRREGRDELVLPEPRLAAAGAFERRSGVLKLARWRLTVDGWVDVGGEAEVDLGPARALDIQRIDGTLFPAKLIPQALAPAAGPKGAPVQVTGAVKVSGRLALKETDRGWEEDGDVTVTFDRNAVTAAVGSLQVDGAVSGTVHGRGRAGAPLIAVRLSGRQIRLGGSGLKVSPFAVDVSAEGTYPALSIPRIEIRVPGVELPVAGRVFAISDLHLRAAQGKIAMDEMAASFPEIRLDSDALRDIVVSLAGDRRRITAEVSGSGTGWAEAAARWQLLPAGWRVAGESRLSARAVILPAGESRLSATLDISGLSFADAKERIMGEGLALRAEVLARSHPDEDGIGVMAEFGVGGGEFLWDRFYLDAGKTPVTLSADLRRESSGGRLRIDSARLAIEHLLAVNVSGHLIPQGLQTTGDLTIEVPPVPVAPVFAAVVAEPLRYRQPALAAASVDGLFSAQVRLVDDGRRRSARGTAHWQSGTAASAGNAVLLEGISLRLPLWYQSGDAGTDGAPMNGKLAIDRATLPLLPVQRIDLPFVVDRNRIDTTGELRIDFPAGAVRIAGISVLNPFGERPTVKTRLTVDGVQVGGYLKTLWTLPVAAVVNGELTDIVFDGRDVRTRGQLVADIFKGRVIVENPGVDAALGSAPNLRGDCLVQAVNLAEATKGTAFGRIQGIMGGYIEDLEIVGGQPQRFNLRLETIPTPGVPQRINIVAVESIARIGGGRSPFMGLAGNVAAFFKEFTYDRIGIRAVLANDVFKINGTVKDGKTEYLVKRGGIPGVNVVNLNPANQISFKDMVKRIRRINESKSGPVVN